MSRHDIDFRLIWKAPFSNISLNNPSGLGGMLYIDEHGDFIFHSDRHFEIKIGEVFNFVFTVLSPYIDVELKKYIQTTFHEFELESVASSLSFYECDCVKVVQENSLLILKVLTPCISDHRVKNLKSEMRAYCDEIIVLINGGIIRRMVHEKAQKLYNHYLKVRESMILLGAWNDIIPECTFIKSYMSNMSLALSARDDFIKKGLLKTSSSNISCLKTSVSFQ